MSSDAHDRHKTSDSWTSYPTDPMAAGEPQNPEHGRAGSSGTGREHKTMMLMMCAPLVLIGIWALASGAGGGALLGGLMCVGMMVAMHLIMGSRQRH